LYYCISTINIKLNSNKKGKIVQIRVSTKDGIPIYLQIINQIKYMVASGRLAPGEKLPPVRKLAEQLLINPNTVARAYRELEAANVLNTRQGSGVFVAEGVSPLARREQNKILKERIDLLLAEAKQMNVTTEAVVELIKQQSQHMK
jgi:GntR family transcriptional regulator